MHMIIISDLLQLQMGDDGQQISEAHLLDKFEFYELQEIRRQDRGPIFRDFLKRARTADLNSSMLKFINDRLTPRGVGNLTGTVDKFLEIHDDHTHVLTSTHKRRRAFNDAIIAQKFQKKEVLHEQIQCIRGANTTLIYEPVPKSDTFRIAEGMRVITTATMMDKDGENVPNGTMGTVKSFTTLRDHVHFVNIQFDGSHKTQRFGRKNPDGTNVFTFNFQPAYAHIPSSPRKNYEWS
ncbi:hypothetical protein B9Z55_012854 [Caenorhabditis nigoni]|uniref:Uncharacterized protein n=3 Tax=Caenorhabditis nigoni TaxID=1611254 RepID=A0A2G5TZB4_9PELO|nr:hypothetical protein B9Z55_012854 [Caenorhabditis nigoni]